MALRGIIFDIDGTLVDTNPAHVEAWRRAFERLGYALATSSDEKHLKATCDSAGIDLPRLAEVVVTKEEAGDMIYDAQASQGAGVVFLGLESTGTPLPPSRRPPAISLTPPASGGLRNDHQ